MTSFSLVCVVKCIAKDRGGGKMRQIYLAVEGEISSNGARDAIDGGVTTAHFLKSE